MWIDASAEAVYEYASDPTHLPEWAPGLASAVERGADGWVAKGPMGTFGFAFAPRNEFGVLDHEVTLASGEFFYNPMRVIADGETCEVVFTLRRENGMTDADYDRDTATVRADLVALKRVLES